MEPTLEQAARLDADRHEAAQRMTFGERLLAGAAALAALWEMLE